jgi:hypothetical protein
MMFGKPGTGFHSTRFLGYAVGDTVGTVVLALLTAWIFKINWVVSIVVWFVVGELLHYYYGLQSAFLTTIGVEACPSTEEYRNRFRKR